MDQATLAAELLQLRALLSLPEWTRRNTVADERAAFLDQVLALVEGGASELAAVRQLAPGEPVSTWVHRLVRYRSLGRDGLLDRRCPRSRSRPLATPEVRGFVRGLLVAKPTLRSGEVRAEVARGLGITLGASTTRQLLNELGLAQRVGRPGVVRVAEPLPLAGAELLLAMDIEIGATSRLTRDLEVAMQSLLPPSPDDTVRDDRAGRDEDGRFVASYNVPKERTEPELGERFDSVQIRSTGKDLTAMRAANSSFASLSRKVIALTMLPVLTDAPQWSALRHWQGDHLKGLVGHAYQPATLDKFARDLKYAGVSGVARESVASVWIGVDAEVADAPKAAAVIYGDARVKPLWTHQFSRSTAVTVLGKRVMPAITTVHLHSGCGTPVIFREFSGGASVPNEIMEMIDEYETHAGPHTARRLVVLDSESHAVWLFKEMEARGRLFLVPLRSSSTGARARFEGVSEWVPYRNDQVCSGWLWVNDSRKGQEPMRVRAVGRRRHRTGNVAWYATNAPVGDFDDAQLLDLYFDRWPLQEHVFRDGNGRVGLGSHHGYGKQKVVNVAVVDEIERLDASLKRTDETRRSLAEGIRTAVTAFDDQEATVTVLEREARSLGLVVGEARRLGRTTARAHLQGETLAALEAAIRQGKERAATLTADIQRQRAADATAAAKEKELASRREKIAAHRTIFTVDTELDEILTAFKLTFMCLCSQLMARYLGTKMELDTLIRGVLTLPGERAITPGVETIRIFRQPRDRDLMPAVEQACRLMTERGLFRDKRRLRFEMVDRPARVS